MVSSLSLSSSENCAEIRATGPPLLALTAQLSGVQGVDLIFLHHPVHCCITAGITTSCDEGDRKNILLILNRSQGLARAVILQFNKRVVWSTEVLERKSHFSTHICFSGRRGILHREGCRAV